MYNLIRLSVAAALLLLSHGASAMVARDIPTPTFVSSSFVGSATDYPDLVRDGGGGGTVNGINVVSRSARHCPFFLQSDKFSSFHS